MFINGNIDKINEIMLKIIISFLPGHRLSIFFFKQTLWDINTATQKNYMAHNYHQTALLCE